MDNVIDRIRRVAGRTPLGYNTAALLMPQQTIARHFKGS